MKFLMFALMGLCGTAHASQLFVVLSVNVSSEYLYSSGQYNSFFVPQTITSTAAFDSTALSIAADPNQIQIYFGVPSVSSPLTSTLPADSGTSTVDPSFDSSQAQMTDYNFGAGDAGSYFQIQESQLHNDSTSQTWAYSLTLSFPGSTVLPPLTSPLTFSGDDLAFWLSSLEKNHTSVMFNEYSNVFNSVTGQYVSGVGYVGQGVILSVTTAPEPATGALVALAFIGAMFCRSQTIMRILNGEKGLRVATSRQLSALRTVEPLSAKIDSMSCERCARAPSMV